VTPCEAEPSVFLAPRHCEPRKNGLLIRSEPIDSHEKLVDLSSDFGTAEEDDLPFDFNFSPVFDDFSLDAILNMPDSPTTSPLKGPHTPADHVFDTALFSYSTPAASGVAFQSANAQTFGADCAMTDDKVEAATPDGMDGSFASTPCTLPSGSHGFPCLPSHKAMSQFCEDDIDVQVGEVVAV
jgi:hypothetical protein